MTWFYIHCVAALTLIYWEYDGSLEDRVNNFEAMIGIYTPPDTTEEELEVPYYIPPTTTPVDSTWILPDSLRRNNE